jgi:hypothetical protein
VARLFGTSILAVDDGDSSQGAAPPRTDECVVGYGPHAHGAAAMYAHLTARRFRTISRAGELDNATRPTVVLMLYDDLDSAFLEQLSISATTGTVTGIIVAADADELWRQALVRAVAATTPAPDDRPRVDLWPLRPFDVAQSGARLFLGSDAAIDEVRQSLAIGASVTHVFTHSDGIDAFLGPGVLCALAGEFGPQGQWRSPRCHLTGQCHRLGLSVADALATGLLISPLEVSARVMVWSTCLGIVPSDWVVAPSWSIAAQLLANPSVGAVITTWSIGALDERVCRRLSDHLAAGMSAGQSLHAALDDHQGGRPRLRMCLFGDPATRAVARDVAVAAAPRPAARSSAMAGNSTPMRNGPRAATWELDVIAALEAKPALPGVIDRPPRQWDKARLGRSRVAFRDWLDLLAKHVSEHGWSWWLDTWARAYEITETEGTCAHCHSRVAGYDGLGRYQSRRHYSSCGRCRRFDDVAEGCDAAFEVQLPDRAELRWEVDGEWAARLRVSSAAQYDTQSWAWPATDDGRPKPFFQLERPFPIGPLRISAILVSDRGLSVLTRIVWHGPAEPGVNSGPRSSS